MVAGRELAALCALVLRHCDLESVTTGTVAGARNALREDRAILLADTTLSGAERLLSGLADGPTATIALVDVEAGGSSYRAFAEGADQVIRLPFTPDELAVRVAALLRRLGQPVRFAHAEPFNGVELSLDEQVHVGSRVTRLSPTLNSLLYLLAANAGVVVSHATIHRLVWGLERGSDGKRVAAAVEQLARALGDHADSHYIVESNATGARLVRSHKS